jgi:hypothetical protein
MRHAPCSEAPRARIFRHVLCAAQRASCGDVTGAAEVAPRSRVVVSGVVSINSDGLLAVMYRRPASPWYANPKRKTETIAKTKPHKMLLSVFLRVEDRIGRKFSRFPCRLSSGRVMVLTVSAAHIIPETR